MFIILFHINKIHMFLKNLNYIDIKYKAFKNYFNPIFNQEERGSNLHLSTWLLIINLCIFTVLMILLQGRM
ncbi:MAG: hypothetical protein A2W74_00280 [Planctomycetes bacterium RIFCSPLOWO2_12_38_17]|nr:MAG: hypothetical protein A2W74_00280 [Planctomycetes bacterium RIFCSPLOWO2_12_38_17]